MVVALFFDYLHLRIIHAFMVGTVNLVSCFEYDFCFKVIHNSGEPDSKENLPVEIQILRKPVSKKLVLKLNIKELYYHKICDLPFILNDDDQLFF